LAAATSDEPLRTVAKVAKKWSFRRPQVKDRGEGGEEVAVQTTMAKVA